MAGEVAFDQLVLEPPGRAVVVHTDLFEDDVLLHVEVVFAQRRAEDVAEQVDRAGEELGQDVCVVDGLLVAGEGVVVGADLVELAVDIVCGPALGALEHHVFEEVGHTHEGCLLIACAGLDEEAAAEKLEKFSEASDEIFAEIVALLSEAGKYPGFPPNCSDGYVAKDGKCVPEETDAEVEESVDADVDEDVDSDEAADEADAETLEEVEEEVEASLTDAGETDSVQEARSVASEWLKSNVLKTTREK